MKIKSAFYIIFGLLILAGMVSAPIISQAAPDADCHARLNDGATDYIVLQDAIDASSNPSDVVKVAGTCSAINIIDKPLTVEGGYTTGNWTTPDPEIYLTIIDAQGISSGVHISSTTGTISVTLQGLRIINGGNTATGGGVYANNTVTTIENCEVLTNTATGAGGGIYLLESPHSKVISSTISNNRAPSAGGIYISTGSHETILEDNLITQNDASPGSGGGIQLANVHNVSITNNELDTNTASQYGAGVMFWGVMTTTVTENTFNNNIAIVYGGGMAFRSNSDWNTVAGNTFTENRATGPATGVSGGAIRIEGSNFNTIQSNAFTGNSTPTNKVSDGNGGAIYIYLAQGNIVKDNDFIENRASYGNAISYDESEGGVFDGNYLYMNTGGSTGNGAIYLTDTDNMTFTQNIVEYSDDVVGALYFTRGDNLTLTENSVHHNGGRGIYIGFGVNLTMEDNEIYENEGGIYIRKMDVSIQRNNIQNNSIDDKNGAGMLLQDITSGMVANNFVADNETLTGEGPGIYLDDSSLSLHHNTIAHNTGGGNQGIYNYLTSDDSDIRSITAAPTVDIINSIITYQEVGIEVSAGTVTTIGDTLWGITETATTQKVVNNGGTVNQTGTYYNQEAGFADPQNGVLYLKSDSSAIDKGTSTTSITDDIQGQPRPYGSENDLGADEYSTLEVVDIAPGGTETTSDGALTIQIPATVTSTITFTYVQQTNPTPGLGSFHFGGVSFQLEAADTDGNPIIEPEPPFTLTVQYDDNNLPAWMREDMLQIRRYDEGTGLWLSLPIISQDTVNNSITAVLDHFSEFALLGESFTVFLPIIIR